jgi:hypothetical protein
MDEELVAAVLVFEIVTAAVELASSSVSITDWLSVPVSLMSTLIVKSPLPLVDAAAIPGVVALDVVAA